MIEIVLDLASLIISGAILAVIIYSNKPKENAIISPPKKISVIIAAKDEPLLEKTLKNLRSIRKPSMEIIVAANGRKTVEIARKYADKVVIDKGIGKGIALNLAVRRASHDVLYFLDADSTVTEDTVAKVCSLGKYAAATGFGVASGKPGIISAIGRMNHSGIQKIQFGLYRFAGTTFVGGRNFAIRRSSLKILGGFRNMLTEDIDLSLRLMEKGKRVKFVDAPFTEQMPEKFSWYIKQQQRWIAGTREAVQDFEKTFRRGDVSILAALAIGGFMPPLSLLFTLLYFLLSEPLLLSVPLLAFIFYMLALRVNGARDVMLSPFTFVCMMPIQTCAVVYSMIKKPTGWYRTPKQ